MNDCMWCSFQLFCYLDGFSEGRKRWLSSDACNWSVDAIFPLLLKFEFWMKNSRFAVGVLASLELWLLTWAKNLHVLCMICEMWPPVMPLSNYLFLMDSSLNMRIDAQPSAVRNSSSRGKMPCAARSQASLLNHPFLPSLKPSRQQKSSKLHQIQSFIFVQKIKYFCLFRHFSSDLIFSWKIQLAHFCSRALCRQVNKCEEWRVCTRLLLKECVALPLIRNSSSLHFLVRYLVSAKTNHLYVIIVFTLQFSFKTTGLLKVISI